LKPFTVVLLALIDHSSAIEGSVEGPIGSGPLVAEKFTFSVVIVHQVTRNRKTFVADQSTSRIDSNLAQASLPSLRIGVPILRLKGPLVAEKSTFSVDITGQQGNPIK
jgi:hypothetical protein